MRTSFFLFAAFLGAISAHPAKKPPPTIVPTDPGLIAKTDHLIFNVTIEEFENARALGLQSATRDLLDPRFDFTSDGCSSSPDHPFGFDFQPACDRHDFAYRNYHKQNRFNETNREELDNNLYNDLLNVCAAQQHHSKEKVCRDVARLYFKAVRKFGGGHKDVLANARRELDMLAMDVELETVANELAEMTTNAAF